MKKNKPSITNSSDFKKIFVVVKFEHKEYFRALFPDTIWRKGKGWEIDDTLENHRKLELWNAQVESLEQNEVFDAIKKIHEGIETLGKKIEEHELKINIIYQKLGLEQGKGKENE